MPNRHLLVVSCDELVCCDRTYFTGTASFRSVVRMNCFRMSFASKWASQKTFFVFDDRFRSESFPEFSIQISRRLSDGLQWQWNECEFRRDKWIDGLHLQ